MLKENNQRINTIKKSVNFTNAFCIVAWLYKTIY